MADRLAAVAELWEAHMQAPLPGGPRDSGAAGVDMVLLDADVSGWVCSWLDQGGAIDDWGWNVLAEREQRLLQVLYELSEDEVTYYQRLLDMTTLVLEGWHDAHPADRRSRY